MDLNTVMSTNILITLSHVTHLEVVEPILQQTEYHFFAREDVSGDTDLGLVAANRDPSIVINSSFLYSVAQVETIFQFEVATGVLSNREDDSFDFESGEECGIL